MPPTRKSDNSTSEDNGAITVGILRTEIQGLVKTLDARFETINERITNGNKRMDTLVEEQKEHKVDHDKFEKAVIERIDMNCNALSVAIERVKTNGESIKTDVDSNDDRLRKLEAREPVMKLIGWVVGVLFVSMAGLIIAYFFNLLIHAP